MSTRSSRFRILGVVLKGSLVVAALATASDAAADAKQISAVACAYQLQGSVVLPYSRDSRFQNTSGATQTVICPIVKEVLAGTMRVFVRSSAFPVVNCRVTRRTGVSLQFFSPTSTTPFPDGTQDINWENPIPGSANAFSVQCPVPHLSSIFGVQSAEP